MLVSVVSKVEQNPKPGRAVGAILFPCPYLAQHEVKSRVDSTELKVFSCSVLALLAFQGRVTAMGRAQLAVEHLSPCVLGFGLGFSFGWVFLLLTWSPHGPWEMWVKALELCGVGFLGQNNPLPRRTLHFNSWVLC